LVRQSPHEITQLLRAYSNGDKSALDQLIPLVHDELRKRAHRYMVCERPGHMLQTTALVNEVYIRLIDASRVRFQDRAHFFAISAKLMRQILVHFARSRDSQKRGSKFRQVSLSKAGPFARKSYADLVKLDDALMALAKIDPRKAKVVELRFFGGLSLAEVAEVLKVSADTVWRDWDLAKTWLWRQIKPAPPGMVRSC
jgi:RNA polymerase sigma-70 factor (ECF subfamily)